MNTHTSNAGDGELIRRLQRGSLEALGQIYDHHQAMVYRTALVITGDPDSAADLAQEVFLRLHRFADHVDPTRPLEPWLYRMTANLSYTWIKRSHRWLPSLDDVTEWLSSSKRPNSEQVVEIDEELHALQHAITRLPLQQRLVVVLYYLNDLSLQEISDILDVPVGTVKSRLYYGREVLKKQLDLLSNDRPTDLQYEFT